MTSHPDKVFGPDRPAGPLPAKIKEMLKFFDVDPSGSTAPDVWPYDPIALAEAVADYQADLCAFHEKLIAREAALRAKEKALAEKTAQFMAQQRAAKAVEKLDALEPPAVDGPYRFKLWR